MKEGWSEAADKRRDAVKLDDYRRLARARLPRNIFDYIAGGACNESTVRFNERDMDAIRLLPLALRDVGDLVLSTDLFGHSFSAPIGFSPTAFHKLVNEDGEAATASAARRLNVPMILSSMSSIALEDVASRSDNRELWFQTYIFKDRAMTKELLERAEQSGYRSIVVTIGCPVAGKRDKNITNKFTLPVGVFAANFNRSNVIVHNNPIYGVERAEFDPSVTWSDIEFIRSQTSLPIMLKGIMNPNDVAPALDLQVSGLIVSNHGGRQLDTTESTIRILPEIADAVGGRVPLLVDSGFRRGTDILKAIALGAHCVLLGRPVLWALAVNGEAGVLEAVNMLREELVIAMQISGCRSIEEIRKNAQTIIRR